MINIRIDSYFKALYKSEILCILDWHERNTRRHFEKQVS